MYVGLVPMLTFRRSTCKLQVPTVTFPKKYMFCRAKMVGGVGLAKRSQTDTCCVGEF